MLELPSLAGATQMIEIDDLSAAALVGASGALGTLAALIAIEVDAKLLPTPLTAIILNS